MRADQFDVELRVVHMADLEGAVAVAGRLQLQFEIEGFLRVRRPMPLVHDTDGCILTPAVGNLSHL